LPEGWTTTDPGTPGDTIRGGKMCGVNAFGGWGEGGLKKKTGATLMRKVEK